VRGRDRRGGSRTCRPPRPANPNPKVDGRGFQRLREAGLEVEVADLWEARVRNEAWRVWIARGRPFVTYKVAFTLDGRVSVPDRGG
jgi:diaminohydroxyphosphoribosylaminopyrimidine deaminase/5-amino-6-(5-phosphoribosylamino)uracil reductase